MNTRVKKWETIFVPGYAVGMIFRMIIELMWNVMGQFSFENYLILVSLLQYWFFAVAVMALVAWLYEYPTEDKEDSSPIE